MDSMTSTFQQGENGHLEYKWSTDIQEKIVQFNTQMVRTTNTTELEKQLHLLLSNKKLNEEQLGLLYAMIGYTRDLKEGKGECQLSYMLIYIWYQYYPLLALFALDQFVSEDPYGSWKDMKYMAEYCYVKSHNQCHPIIQHIVLKINQQLKIEEQKNGKGLTLLAKWIPRESSKFGWLNKILAFDYYKEYIQTSNKETIEKAEKKCLMNYRKLINYLNKTLDTIQIKQCGHQWKDIDHHKTTSITLIKQTKALMNINKKGNERKHNLYEDKIDRELCASNFKQYIENRIKDNKSIKGECVGMIDFAKKGLELYKTDSQIEKDVLNSQWRDNSSLNQKLGNFIAMVDTSLSMTWEGGDPYHVALSLGIRIAEKSSLGKRILTFSSEPTWINLKDKDNYVDMIETVAESNAGYNTNFYKALDLILTIILSKKISPAEVSNMVLVVLSDMQIDIACDNKGSLYDGIDEKYKKHGYTPPHILFWNLRSTNGFPVSSSQPNCTMISGFSPSLLNAFCDKGMEALKDIDPYNMLKEMILKPRYKILIDKVNE
jgi:hypothetical protein